MTAWGAGAIYYSPIPNVVVRAGLAAIFVVATVLAFLLLPRRPRTLVGFFVTFAALVGLYFQIPASNDRNWEPEVAVTPYATIKGDLITIHGVRNFDYRTETDFTPRWEHRTYDLRPLGAADLIAVYCAGKAIAHIMLSFVVGGRDSLSVWTGTRDAQDTDYQIMTEVL